MKRKVKRCKEIFLLVVVEITNIITKQLEYQYLELGLKKTMFCESKQTRQLFFFNTLCSFNKVKVQRGLQNRKH